MADLADDGLASRERPAAVRFAPSRQTLASGATMLVLIAAWFVATTAFHVSPLVLPSPRQLVTEFGNLLSVGYGGQPLYAHIAMSLFRSLVGLVTGVLVAVPVGLWMGHSRTVNAVLAPVLGFIRPIPPIAFIPLMILWFGIGEVSKILLIFAASFNYTVLNSAAGMRAVPEQLLRKGRNLGLTSWQLFTSVMLPAAMPHIFTGIKVSTAVSWAIVVAAELIAAQAGLGFIIEDAGTFFRIADVFIGIIIIGLIGLSLELAITMIERRMLHWQGK